MRAKKSIKRGYFTSNFKKSISKLRPKQEPMSCVANNALNDKFKKRLMTTSNMFSELANYYNPYYVSSMNSKADLLSENLFSQEDSQIENTDRSVNKQFQEYTMSKGLTKYYRFSN